MKMLAGLSFQWKPASSRSGEESSEPGDAFHKDAACSDDASEASWEVVERSKEPPRSSSPVAACGAGEGSPSPPRTASRSDFDERDWQVFSPRSCTSFGSTPSASDLGQKASEGCRTRTTSLSGTALLAMAELQVAHRQLGFSPLALLGDWVDSIGHEVVVVSLDAFRLSLSADISWNSRWSRSKLNKWEAKLKIWIGQRGIWSCGNGFLDTRVSSPARLRWCRPDGTFSEWIRTSPPSALAISPHDPPGSGATATNILQQVKAKYEVDAVSISLCSACSSSQTRTPIAVRYEVEEEIKGVLAQNRTLQRLDFDGRVRQYLHAIRNVGGQGKLREAMWELHEATVSRSRREIQKRPAYVKALLKRFFAGMSGKEQQLRRHRRLP